MSEPTPIGCCEEEARKYMGLSANLFEMYRRRGIIVPIARGYYSYNLLDQAMRQIEQEALSKTNNIIHLHKGNNRVTHEENSRLRKKARAVGGKGHQPEHWTTEELLRQITSRSRKKSTS